MTGMKRYISMRGMALTVALAILFLGVQVAVAQEAPTAPEIEGSEVLVEMPDGVMLRTVVYLPTGNGPFPTIFLVTPYGTEQQTPEARRFARDGYAMVTQNVRGQGGSEGQSNPFLDEIPDLTAGLEWILEQSWSDGRVGLIGNSSQSYSAQLLASTGHPSIKALINISGLTEPQEVFFPGGAFRLNTLYPWMQFFYLHKPIRDREEWKRRFEAAPISEGFEWEEGLMRKMAAGRVDTSGIRVPALHVTGWNDVVYRQTLILHSELDQAGREQQLLVGAWMHNHIGSEDTQFGDEDFGKSSIVSEEELHELYVNWFDRHVRGEGALGPVAKIFVMGRNEWVEFDAWPPQDAREHTLYLSASAGPGAPGGLIEAAESEVAVSYHYDPQDPVPTFGGVNSHLFPAEAGPRDQAAVGQREDVLVFTSDPLEEPLVLAGPQKVMLRASSSAVDADFVVKLVIVRPDGYSRIVEDGIIRARHRESYDRSVWLEPGVPVDLTVDLGSTAIEVPAGHQIGIQVASSNFPKYDRNPSSKADPLSATELLPARQTLHLGGESGSRLVLSILP